MIANRDLKKIASAIDDAMTDPRVAPTRPNWTEVERLRLKADLFGRLAAAGRSWTNTLGRRAELLRDRAERMAEQLNDVPLIDRSGQEAADLVALWADAGRDAGRT
jgi:hypothetical protein